MGLLTKDLSISPGLEIVAAHPDHLSIYWPIVEPWLDASLAFGPKFFETADIRQKVAEKDMICWLALVNNEIVGFSITSIVLYPRAKVCDIHWTGGARHKGRQWLKGMMEVLKNWAKLNDCTMVGGGGRRGWLNVFGFKEHGVMFVMEI